MDAPVTTPPLEFAAFAQQAPGVVAALRALGQAVDASGLDKRLTELLKIRASQLNGCAFCLQFHLDLARRLGVPARQIDLVAVWHEIDPALGVFDARERAALAWTEALTRMGERPIDAAVRQAAQQAFPGAELAHLSAAIGAINAWNRIAGGLAIVPPLGPAA